MCVSLDVKENPFSDYGSCSETLFIFMWLLVEFWGKSVQQLQRALNTVKNTFDKNMSKECDATTK